MKYANLKLPPKVLVGLKAIATAHGQSMIDYVSDLVESNGGDDEGMIFLKSLPEPPTGTHIMLVDGRTFSFTSLNQWEEVLG